MTLGILPGADAREANDYVRQAIPTGLGVVRNLVVVTAADAVLAVGGRHGTLSEIGLALRMGRHVVTLSSWRLESDHRQPGPRVHRARDPREAVALALRLAEGRAGAARLGSRRARRAVSVSGCFVDRLHELARGRTAIDSCVPVDLPAPRMI